MPSSLKLYSAYLAHTSIRHQSKFSSTSYVNDLYLRWKTDPAKVHSSWGKYFARKQPQKSSTSSVINIDRRVAINEIVNSYRSFGHRAASIDPLGMFRADRFLSPATELDPSLYKISPDMSVIGFDDTIQTVDDFTNNLKGIYCGNLGVEYMHLHKLEMREWIREKIEKGKFLLDKQTRLVGLMDLMKASLFEEYTARQFRFETVFYAEGCESFIPALTNIINQSSRFGVEDFVIGMPHRGRSAVVCNVLNHDLADFFKLFNPNVQLYDEGAGDSKYHLGGYFEGQNSETGKTMRISLLSNASHLESISPIAQGRTTALQIESGDLNGNKSLCILVHGDGAVAGQGVAYESAQMTNLSGFSSNGIVHIVANNQLGFTAEREAYCSSGYCTDMLKAMDAPVFHINAEDVDAVLYASQLAAGWRNKFRHDVVLDVVGYRKYGHNEGDDPKPTQPIMYKKIENRKSILSIYLEKCVRDGIISQSEYEKWANQYHEKLNIAYEVAKKDEIPKDKVWWDVPLCEVPLNRALESTGVKVNTLTTIANTVCQTDTGSFKATKPVSRLLSRRLNLYENNNQIDFALAESLAFGTILMEGINIRLTGQDCERGTFAHRHCVIHDCDELRKVRIPLNELPGETGRFDVNNSSLSEYAVLGHQYGYSLQLPNTLCIWEAQYGDFANNAQCIIDQYVVSGAAKWHHQSSMIMLLPHGMDGAGPEHSSSRPERYLQMTNEPFDHALCHDPLVQLERSNFIMVNCSTAANYFHMFRRHAHMTVLRPLIVLSPKSLLRNQAANSSINDVLPETRFQRVIDEVYEEPARKIMFCSGKVFYDLLERRNSLSLTSVDVRIVRLEQITPFPHLEVENILNKNKSAQKVIWVQEEHQNMGVFAYVKPKIDRISEAIGGMKGIEYAGRRVCSTPITANKARLNEEKERFLKEAFED